MLAKKVLELVQRALLMRIFAVASIEYLAARDKFFRAEAAVKALVHIVCDHRVVGCGVLISFNHQILPKFQLLALVRARQNFQNRVVIKRTCDYIDASKILSCRAHHRGAADVDIFDDL